jgi:hypothetical protein
MRTSTTTSRRMMLLRAVELNSSAVTTLNLLAPINLHGPDPPRRASRARPRRDRENKIGTQTKPHAILCCDPGTSGMTVAARTTHARADGRGQLKQKHHGARAAKNQKAKSRPVNPVCKYYMCILHVEFNIENLWSLGSHTLQTALRRARPATPTRLHAAPSCFHDPFRSFSQHTCS